MQKWEYLIADQVGNPLGRGLIYRIISNGQEIKSGLGADGIEISKWLSDLGLQGWDLISSGRTYVFKRPKP